MSTDKIAALREQLKAKEMILRDRCRTADRQQYPQKLPVIVKAFGRGSSDSCRLTYRPRRGYVITYTSFPEFVDVRIRKGLFRWHTVYEARGGATYIYIPGSWEEIFELYPLAELVLLKKRLDELDNQLMI